MMSKQAHNLQNHLLHYPYPKLSNNDYQLGFDL